MSISVGKKSPFLSEKLEKKTRIDSCSCQENGLPIERQELNAVLIIPLINDPNERSLLRVSLMLV